MTATRTAVTGWVAASATGKGEGDARTGVAVGPRSSDTADSGAVLAHFEFERRGSGECGKGGHEEEGELHRG